MTATALKFQIGARTLAAIPKRLVRVALSLDEVMAGAAPVLPMLDPGADGYLVTSLPEGLERRVASKDRSHRRSFRAQSRNSSGTDGGGFSTALETNGTGVSRDAARAAPAGLIARVRQRYTRYYVDLAAGEAAWLAALSGQTRSGLKRKAKKLGGEVRAYRTAAELAAFHPLARAVSATTYQERLLDSGLPGDADFLARMYALAADDAVRAWLLFVDAAPVAYLWCAAQGSTLRYDYVGHDPAFAALSPGTVLMHAALRDLFADRFARFDFTEGEGQHKRGLASGGVACVDLLLLRPTVANRVALAALAGFDGAMAWGKRLARGRMMRRLAERVRR